MMAQPAVHGPVSVVSPRFCLPHAVDLAITKKVWQITGRGDLVVDDVNGNLMFKVERSLFSFERRRVILDAAGIPIINLRKQTLTAHGRWQVFRGESRDGKDLVFSARRSSVIQMKTKLHVFLANNTSEDVCDYTVQGSWFQRSFKVYAGASSTMVAQMHKNSSAGSIITGKNKYMVTVYPNIDCAFIVALIVILDEINSQRNRSSHHTHRHTHGTTI